MLITRYVDNETVLKKYISKNFAFGQLYLAEHPYISFQHYGKYFGKRTLYIRFFDKFVVTPTIQHCLDTSKVLVYDSVEIFTTKFYNTYKREQFDHVVFCGGEPFIWQFHLVTIMRFLIDRMRKDSLTFEIESPGVFDIEPQFSDWIKKCHVSLYDETESEKVYYPMLNFIDKEHYPSRNQSLLDNIKTIDHSDWRLYVDYNGDKTIDYFTRKYYLPYIKNIYLKSKEDNVQCCEQALEHGFNYMPFYDAKYSRRILL
jgi:organic radical activating enzyme